MISRSAENCFWLCRHLERVESIARFLSANYLFVLDFKIAAHDAWFPFIVVTGIEARFSQHYGDSAIKDAELIQDYLVWNPHNPVSIYNTLRQARENAQVIRDIISSELWEAINGFWLWLKSRKSQYLYRKDRLGFFAIIKQNCHIFHGLFHTSIPHEEAYHFMSMGMMLERAHQTARILDVKYHRISLSAEQEKESALETAHWLALLQLCSAHEAFSKHRLYVQSDNVIEFLIFESNFPRSIIFCLLTALASLEQIRLHAPPNIGYQVLFLIKKLTASLQHKNIKTIMQAGLHHELTRIVDQTGLMCDRIHTDYFSNHIINAAETRMQPLEVTSL